MADLSETGQELMNSLKLSVNGYHPLEKYIRAYDSNLDNTNALRSIGERIGIYIPEDENVGEGFYLKLKEYIEKENDPQITEKIIQLTPDEYEKYIISLNPSNYKLTREQFYPLYSDRLYLSLSE